MKILDALKRWIQAYLNALWLSLSKTKTRIILATATIISSIAPAFAQTDSTTTEITNVVLAWMPLIIIFAMLGMVLGMLRKFGKF